MELSRTLKTNAISLFLYSITGESPVIEKYPDYNQLVLSNEQKEKLRQILTEFMAREPGEIRMELQPIILPVLLKRYWPWLAGISAGALLLGLFLKG